MSKVDTIQTSFTAGEIAPALFGRTDVAQYANACALVENFLIRPYGPLISTPGTEFINACKTGGSTGIVRTMEFIFSRTDSFIIEFGVGYFRFFTNGAVVVSTGTTPYEVSHTYSASEIPDVQISQLNDVIYLDHGNHPPAKLTRFSANNWTLTSLPITGGPFTSNNIIYSGGTTSILSSATLAMSVTAAGSSGTLVASANVFIASGSTLGHINTFWKIGPTVTDSTTGLDVQGFVQITAITNPSTATATVVKALSSTASTTVWAQGAWSYVMGWPARITFHQQRLFHARTTYQPQNVWGSKSFTYENYAVDGGEDDDAIDIQLTSTESNDIKWLVSGDGLIAGTYGGEFIIDSGDGSPLTPSNTNVKKQTSEGSEPIQPKRIGNYFYYIQRFAKKMRELFFIWNVNSYKSLDKTILSPHISGSGGFINMSYQQDPDTILWAVCSNGTLATLTREVDQEVQGWSRQITDGYYESIATIPSQDGPHDEIWVVVRRNINGSDVRYIERFKSQIVPDRQDQCFYVHCGLTYDAFEATTVVTSGTISAAIFVLGGGASCNEGIANVSYRSAGAGSVPTYQVSHSFSSGGSYPVVVGSGSGFPGAGAGVTGGASSIDSVISLGGQNPPTFNSNQGGSNTLYTGANGNSEPPTVPGGGGAGAGGNGSGSHGKDGGIGVANSISGTSTRYGGGGAGLGNQGSGIAVDGGGTPGGAAATANRGGGGCADSGGSSGIVIISYPTPDLDNGTGGTITHVGGNTIHTFTTSGTFTPPTTTSGSALSLSASSGTTVIASSTVPYFSSGSVGKRIRTIDSDGVTVGELEITGYTSSTVVVGKVKYVFDSLTYDAGSWGLSVMSISGLGHLEAKSLSVLADGGTDKPHKTVSNGSITMAYDYFVINAGLPYTQKIKTLPQEAGSNRGTSQGQIQRINEVGFKVNRSFKGFLVGGTVDRLTKIQFRDPTTLLGSPEALFTGTIPKISFADDYQFGSQVLIYNEEPLPIELLSIITQIETF